MNKLASKRVKKPLITSTAKNFTKKQIVKALRRTVVTLQKLQKH